MVAYSLLASFINKFQSDCFLVFNSVLSALSWKWAPRILVLRLVPPGLSWCIHERQSGTILRVVVRWSRAMELPTCIGMVLLGSWLGGITPGWLLMVVVVAVSSASALSSSLFACSVFFVRLAT